MAPNRAEETGSTQSRLDEIDQGIRHIQEDILRMRKGIADSARLLQELAEARKKTLRPTSNS